MDIRDLEFLDFQSTKKEAVKVLKKYRKCRARLAYQESQRITTKYKETPSGSYQRVYDVERIAINNISASEYIESVNKAISKLDFLEQRIIKEKFLNKHIVKDSQVFNHMYISSSSYYEKKLEALIKLAYYLGVEVIKEVI